MEHTTPASLECEQELTPTTLLLKLNRLDSVPEHLTLYRSNGPVPCPKAARVTATVAMSKKESLLYSPASTTMLTEYF